MEDPIRCCGGERLKGSRNAVSSFVSSIAMTLLLVAVRVLSSHTFSSRLESVRLGSLAFPAVPSAQTVQSTRNVEAALIPMLFSGAMRLHWILLAFLLVAPP